MKKFPKWLLALIIVLVCILGIGSCYSKTYNSLVTQEENVSAQWSEVQNQYQRRMDLIPNLVSTDRNYEIGYWGRKHKEYIRQYKLAFHYLSLS